MFNHLHEFPNIIIIPHKFAISWTEGPASLSNTAQSKAQCEEENHEVAICTNWCPDSYCNWFGVWLIWLGFMDVYGVCIYIYIDIMYLFIESEYCV